MPNTPLAVPKKKAIHKVQKVCLNCSQEFLVWPYRAKTAQYCSQKCGRCSRTYKKVALALLGRKLSSCHIQKLKFARKRLKEKQGYLVSPEARIKIANSERGEKSHFWQGGKTEQKKLILGSVEYKLWREAVFKRDNYTCVICGDNHGGNLEADHIKPQAYFPELRFAIDNGRTLCKSCHKLTDTWGWKAYHKYGKYTVTN